MLEFDSRIQPLQDLFQATPPRDTDALASRSDDREFERALRRTLRDDQALARDRQRLAAREERLSERAEARAQKLRAKEGREIKEPPPPDASETADAKSPPETVRPPQAEEPQENEAQAGPEAQAPEASAAAEAPATTSVPQPEIESTVDAEAPTPAQIPEATDAAAVAPPPDEVAAIETPPAASPPANDPLAEDALYAADFAVDTAEVDRLLAEALGQALPAPLETGEEQLLVAQTMMADAAGAQAGAVEVASEVLPSQLDKALEEAVTAAAPDPVEDASMQIPDEAQVFDDMAAADDLPPPTDKRSARAVPPAGEALGRQQSSGDKSPGDRAADPLAGGTSGRAQTASAAPAAGPGPAGRFADALLPSANAGTSSPTSIQATPTGTASPAGAQAATGDTSLTFKAETHGPRIKLPTEEISLAISRNHAKGQTKFEIRLDPPELGRIDVRLEIGDDGETRTRMIAERPETLDLLQRDQRSLEKALNALGFKADRDSLDFSLQQDARSKGRGQAFQGFGGGQRLEGVSAAADRAEAAAPLRDAFGRLRLNIII